VILVTGATGFIGSHLVAALRLAGHDVLGVSRYDPRDETRFLVRDAGEVAFVRMDPDDEDYADRLLAEYRPRVVVHLDANVNPPGLEREPERAVAENFLATFRWMQACVRHGVPRFLLASSIGVLPRVQYEPIDEAHPLVLANEGPGSSFYGASKGACELFGMSFRKSSGLEFSAIRCSAVYGFGMQWPIGIKPAIEAIAAGSPLTVPGYGPPRDYTSVDYVVEIFLAAALADPAPAGILYAATGRELVTVAQLNDTLRAEFPDASITVTDENTDPAGIESLYRGVIDMAPTRHALGLSTPSQTLAQSLRSAVETQRAYTAWLAGERD